MKKQKTLVLCLLVVAMACNAFQEKSVYTERPHGKTEGVFYASLEQSGASDATKVYADEDLKVLWNANDRISIYNRYTYGYEYAFQGATGKTAGAFAKVADDAEFVTGNPLDKIYAVYPYSQENDISNTGELSVRWPSTQTYKPDSFGIGSNVMVSVTTDNQLRFRNVGGYLAFKLYGDNVSVTSITLRGNNGEKLSGKATVSASTDEDPMLSFDVSAQGSIRLNCTQPVAIGTTADEATIFWLVVPPTQFTQGFNITVRTSDGGIFFKSTDANYDIERNTLCRMAAVEVIPGDIIPFKDANFKAYCVESIDTNGDGDISIAEALSTTTIDVCTDNIYSLQGLEFFENLEELTCRGTWNYELGCGNGKLASLDVGNNGALSWLDCRYNQLECLDVSNNKALTKMSCNNNHLTILDVTYNSVLSELNCSNNLLTALDVSKNTLLLDINCDYNQLAILDISKNTALTELWCQGNQLISLDVSNNSVLLRLVCDNNQLTFLDVSKNTTLTELWCQGNNLISLDVTNNLSLKELMCDSNHLTELDVSLNTVLTWLSCGCNHLAELDVSQNTALTLLSCGGNQLTSLDVSKNTALTHLTCPDNQLEVLNVSYNTALVHLNCHMNQLMNLDVSYNTELMELYCHENLLTSLDVSENLSLTNLSCWGNQLTLLDVSKNSTLIGLTCGLNPNLTEIWLKIGQTIQDFSYNNTISQVYYKN